MGWTSQQAREHEMRIAMQKRLKSEERTRTKIQHENHNPPQGLPAAVSQSDSGPALVEVASGEATSRTRAPQRAKITFIVRAVRPCDYDNWHIKFLQDCLVASGILDDDNWKVLSGEVISKKIDIGETEGTTVIIETLP